MIKRARTALGRRSPLQILIWSLWAFLLLSVPMTSSPIIGRFTGGSTVSPLAGLPLAGLLIFWLIPSMIRERKLPAVSIPLFVFIGVALLSSALALFYEIYPVMGQTVPGRTLRGLLTLGVGVGFYLVTWRFSGDEQTIRRSLACLYLGGIIFLTWASIQSFFFAQGEYVPSKLRSFHRLFSIRDLLEHRTVGFTYEPSWLGDQLVILYLPLWLASVVRKYSIFCNKPKRATVELGLLIWGAVILFFSHSRIGLLSAILSVGALGLSLGWELAGRGVDLIRLRWFSADGGSAPLGKIPFQLAFWLSLVIILLLMGFALVKLSSQSDWRLVNVFEIDYLQFLRGLPSSFFGLSERLAYAERVMWWTMGTRVFSQHPILGVGLGVSGFFFKENVPAYAYHLPEMVWAFQGKLYFPNPTSLWIRLLAETGIVGFLVFTGWLALLAIGAKRLISREWGWRSMIGLAGLIALIAQITEGFSLSSFALPQLWIMLGLLTAAISPTSNREIRRETS